MWEKDLIKQHQKPYMSKWALGQAPLLVSNQPEQRDDDFMITPRGEPAETSVFDLPKKDV